MGIDVSGTIAGLDLLAKRVDQATRQIVADVAHLFQAAGIDEAPVGVSGNSTNAPGDLRRSIDVQGPTGRDGIYEALVGPTVVYGRQRELGGAIYPVTATFLRFEKFGVVYYRTRVFQEANPYMKRGYVQTLPSIEPVARERLRAAITGR